LIALHDQRTGCLFGFGFVFLSEIGQRGGFGFTVLFCLMDLGKRYAGMHAVAYYDCEQRERQDINNT
jgi:hypothetical protein